MWYHLSSGNGATENPPSVLIFSSTSPFEAGFQLRRLSTRGIMHFLPQDSQTARQKMSKTCDEPHTQCPFQDLRTRPVETFQNRVQTCADLSKNRA